MYNHTALNQNGFSQKFPHFNTTFGLSTIIIMQCTPPSGGIIAILNYRQ